MSSQIPLNLVPHKPDPRFHGSHTGPISNPNGVSSLWTIGTSERRKVGRITDHAKSAMDYCNPKEPMHTSNQINLEGWRRRCGFGRPADLLR